MDDNAGFKAPRLIGHRGAAALAPENTLASIRAAAESGVSWVEVDAKLARDKVPVLMHDAVLDRTTAVRGPVAAHTAAALARVDAGSWFGPDFAGEPVPTLADGLAECRRLGLGLDLEIKPDKGAEAATAAACIAALDAARWTAADPILITSFAPAALKIFRDYAPTFQRGLLIWKFPEGWYDAALDLGVVSVISDQQSLETEAHVARLAANGWVPMTYTVNNPARAALLYGWGIEGIVTDNPPALLGL